MVRQYQSLICSAPDLAIPLFVALELMLESDTKGRNFISRIVLGRDAIPVFRRLEKCFPFLPFFALLAYL